MITKLKRSQLAKALGLKHNASITQAIKNRKLILEPCGKLIDVDKEFNKIWIRKQEIKNKTPFDINRAVLKEDKPKKFPNDTEKHTERAEIESSKENIDSKKLTLDIELERAKKQADIRKLDNEDRLKKIEISKKEGELVPIEETRFVFTSAIEYFRGAFIDRMHSLIGIFANEKKFNEISREIYDMTDSITATAKEGMIKELDNIVEQYKEVLGRGQKK